MMFHMHRTNRFPWGIGSYENPKKNSIKITIIIYHYIYYSFVTIFLCIVGTDREIKDDVINTSMCD